MGRAHDGFLSPTDIAEAHPWSEDLHGVLEDAGVPAEIVGRATEMFDKALEADHIKPIGYDSLFWMASLCREFDREHAVFWHNSSGEMKSVSGYCYEETLTKALNECLDQDGIDLVVEIENYLFDTKKLDDDTYEKAVSILRRLRYTYVLTAALGGGGGR